MQLDALREAGCEKVFAEKKSGTSTSGRDALAEALDCVQDSSDTLIVTRLDRSAGSAGDLHAIVAKLSANLPVRLQASDAVWQSLFFLFAPLAVGLFAIRNYAAVFLACLFPMRAMFAAKSRDSDRKGKNTPKSQAMAFAAILVPLILVTG